MFCSKEDALIIMSEYQYWDGDSSPKGNRLSRFSTISSTEADAFQYFKENGVFDPLISKKFKTLLESGGTKDPMELYKNFRGSEPKVESLLKRAFG